MSKRGNSVDISVQLMMVSWYLKIMTYLQQKKKPYFFKYGVLIIINIMHIIVVAGEQNIRLILPGNVNLYNLEPSYSFYPRSRRYWWAVLVLVCTTKFTWAVI